MRQILFLDIDGVLNIQSKSYSTHQHREWLCEPHLVARLDYLCKKLPELEIVISSSWRFDMDALQETLEKCGFQSWGRVVGRTSISGHAAMLPRGKQIQEWLEENIAKAFVPRLDAIIFIIDDEPTGIEKFWSMDSFFTDPTVGLSDELIDELLERADLADVLPQ